MQFPIYFVDAFTLNDQSFTGNSAAVCVLQFDNDISDENKQKIASEINLSETAFVAKAWNKGSKVEENCFTLRWFTPTTEVELCGHATLASASVVFNQNLGKISNKIKFETKFKGSLEAIKNLSENSITLDFPLNDCKPLDNDSNQWIPQIISNTFGPDMSADLIQDIQYSSGTKKLLLRLKDSPESEKLIYKVTPNPTQLLSINTNGLIKGVIVTQKGQSVHFLSRYFSPWNGINEDPVTGAAHTVLAPYWHRQYKESGVNTDQLVGQQCSQRGGTVVCKVNEKRVQMSGKTKAFISGVITL